MEYIKDNQPTTVMSLDDLNLHVPNIDKATLEYSHTNLYAVLITYTVNVWGDNMVPTPEGGEPQVRWSRSS